MSDSEDMDTGSSTRESFHRTTVRLVTEFIQKTGQDPRMVKLKSFSGLFKHLNPLAPVPTVPAVESCAASRGYAEPTACLVCGVNGVEEETVSLNADHAAIVLTALVLEAGRDRIEAARRLQSESLRICNWHFDEVFEMMFNGLNIQNTCNLRDTPSNLMNNWCTMFIGMKMIRDQEEDPEFDIVEFLYLMEEFKDMYYQDEKEETSGSSRQSSVKIEPLEYRNDYEEHHDAEEDYAENEEEYDNLLENFERNGEEEEEEKYASAASSETSPEPPELVLNVPDVNKPTDFEPEKTTNLSVIERIMARRRAKRQMNMDNELAANMNKVPRLQNHLAKSINASLKEKRVKPVNVSLLDDKKVIEFPNTTKPILLGRILAQRLANKRSRKNTDEAVSSSFRVSSLDNSQPGPSITRLENEEEEDEEEEGGEEEVEEGGEKEVQHVLDSNESGESSPEPREPAFVALSDGTNIGNK